MNLTETSPIEYELIEIVYDPSPVARLFRLLSGKRPFTIGADVFDPEVLAILSRGRRGEKFTVGLTESDDHGVCIMQVVSAVPLLD